MRYQRFEIKCEKCAKSILIPKHRLNKARFCSHKCYSESLSKGRNKECKVCSKLFYASPSKDNGVSGIFCSKACATSFRLKGSKLSAKRVEQMKIIYKKRVEIKENHPRYKKDRSTLVKKQERNDPAYKDWRKQVWQRDNWKCKMLNNDCHGENRSTSYTWMERLPRTKI